MRLPRVTAMCRMMHVLCHVNLDVEMFVLQLCGFDNAS